MTFDRTLDIDLTGKNVVVTGGSRGIGLAVVSAFAGAGASVTSVDVRESDRADQLPEVRWLIQDVSSTEGVDAVLAANPQGADVLVNNAGITGSSKGTHELDDDDWARVMAVNVGGAFLMARRFLPGMLERGHGVIINVGSIAGLRGGRTGPAYTASKYAVVGLTYNIASMYGHRGIRCNAICPGKVTTDISSAALHTEAVDWLRTRDQYVPPAADPADIAKTVVFLASDNAQFVNGVALPIDSGRSAF